jgi:hypothetical protein
MLLTALRYRMKLKELEPNGLLLLLLLPLL